VPSVCCSELDMPVFQGSFGCHEWRMMGCGMSCDTVRSGIPQCLKLEDH